MAWGKGLSFLYGPLRGRATLTQVLRYGGNRRWPASYLPLTLSFSEGKCSSKLKKIELFLKLIFVGVDLPGCISFCCAAVSQLYTYTYPLFGFPFHSEFHVLYNGSHQLSILYIVSTVYICQSQMVILFLARPATSFSKVTVPSYILTRNEWGLQSVNNLINSCYYLSFDNNYISLWVRSSNSLGSWFTFLWWLTMHSFFSYFNSHLYNFMGERYLFRTFSHSKIVLFSWIVRVLYIFWIQVP